MGYKWTEGENKIDDHKNKEHSKKTTSEEAKTLDTPAVVAQPEPSEKPQSETWDKNEIPEG